MTDNDALVRELLPCPFCGADAEIEQDSDHHGEWFNLGCSRHWGHVRNPDHQNTCIAGRIFYTETDVTEAEAIASWNTRSTPQPKPLDPPAQDEVEVVAVAVAQSTPQPGAVVNQCLAELGDAEPLVVSKEDDGWAVRTLSAWRLLHPAGDDALREENARLRGALRDASVSLCWAARQMKGNCNGGAVDAVNLAAGNASSVAALTRRQG
jgi:hypothetical protein